MPRAADSTAQAKTATAVDGVDTSGSVAPPSVPPPATHAPAAELATPVPETAPGGVSDGSHGADDLNATQAEALAKVAALAANRHGDGGPSRMIVGTAITLGVLVFAVLTLALALSL